MLCRLCARRVHARARRLTGLAIGLRVAAELHIHKVDLQLLLRLDTDEQRRAAARHHHLGGVVRRLEHEGEGTLLRSVGLSAAVLGAHARIAALTSSLTTLLIRLVKSGLRPEAES